VLHAPPWTHSPQTVSNPSYGPAPKGRKSKTCA